MSQDAEKKLDAELIEFFSVNNLDPVKAETILCEAAQLKHADTGKLSLPGRRRFGSRIAAWLGFNNNFRLQAVLTAATLCIAATSIYVGFGIARHDKQSTLAANTLPSSVTSLSDLVLREAAMNHQTKLKLDVKAVDLNELQQGMERLDFKVALPEALQSDFQLIGGRYCTIAGQLAAHIRFEGSQADHAINQVSEGIGSVLPENQGTSLFVTPYSPDLGLLGDMSSQFPGDIAVRSWKQGDLYYVLAEGQKS